MSSPNQNNNFTVSLYSKICDENPCDNFVFSPFSIQVLLGMCYSATNGQTAEEIFRVLRIPITTSSCTSASLPSTATTNSQRNEIEKIFKEILDSNRSDGRLFLANKFYAKNDYKFIDDFKIVAKDSYHSEVDNIDFMNREDAANIINNWIESQTTNKVRNTVINPDIIDSTSTLILTNALYLKANWKNCFHKISTYVGDFWNNGIDLVKTNTMSVYEGYYQYCEIDCLNAKAIQFDYENDKLKILFIVPNEKTDLPDLEKNIKNINLFEIANQLERTLVNLNLPKFKVEFDMNLKPILAKEGITKFFEIGSADFSNSLITTDSVKVSQIIHKVCFDVNEEGTEARPPTPNDYNLAICPGYHPTRPKDMKINKPFLYAVKDDKNIYYFGRVRTIPKHSNGL